MADVRGPGTPVSRVLYPLPADGDHLSSPPNSVKRCGASVVHETMSPSGSSSQPGDGPGAHCPSIRPCSRWGLAAAASPQSAGRSYRPISPLSRQAGTVCFCATFRLLRHSVDYRRSLGVTQHPARRSPDFPPQRSEKPDRCGGHPAYPGPVHPPLRYTQWAPRASTG